MFDINELFKEASVISHNELDSGKGVLDDIRLWSNRYTQHLEHSNMSQNTVSLYNVTLKALYDYTEQFNSNIGGISAIIGTLNSFLEWMEQYGVNKLYGSQKQRIEMLVKFIQASEVLTVSNYHACADRFYLDLDDDLVDMTGYVIDDFYGYFSNIGEEITSEMIKGYIGSRHKLSAATMNQRKIALVAFLKFIDKSMKGKYFSNEIWQLKTYKETKKNNEIKTGLSEDDDIKIEAYLRTDPSDAVAKLGRIMSNSIYCEWRNRAMLVLMKRAGLRTSEALGLKFSDISLNKSGATYVLRVVGKGNKERRVPISKRIFEPYFSYLQSNKKGEFLSSTDTGTPMKRHKLHAEIKEIYVSAGVNRSGLHILRHHFGSTFAAKNGNMKILQDILGHSIITTTMIYSHVADEVMADAVDRLE